MSAPRSQFNHRYFCPSALAPFLEHPPEILREAATAWTTRGSHPAGIGTWSLPLGHKELIQEIVEVSCWEAPSPGIRGLEGHPKTTVPGLEGDVVLHLGDGNPLQCSCLKNPMDRGAWQATVQGVSKSQT